MAKTYSINPLSRKLFRIIYLNPIALLPLLPTSNLPEIPYFSGEDKIIHFGMYAGLGFIACWILNISSNRIKSNPLILLIIVMSGVVMEILQRLKAKGRSLAYMDMLANVGIAVAGLVTFNYMIKVNNAGFIR